MVYFGGSKSTDYATVMGDTWSYSGVQPTGASGGVPGLGSLHLDGRPLRWLQRRRGRRPGRHADLERVRVDPRDPARRAAAPSRCRIRLRSGPQPDAALRWASDTAGGDLNDTWLWNGSNWSMSHPKTSPSPRDGAAVALSDASNRVVLAGGYQASDGHDLADTWVWTGSDWQAQRTSFGPSPRFGATAAYDDATRHWYWWVGRRGGTSISMAARLLLGRRRGVGGPGTTRARTSGRNYLRPRPPDGSGYWLTAADGRTYGFGDAWTSSVPIPAHLNRPIIGAVPTPSGHGYWQYASDGGVFTYGDAGFFGSAATGPLASPVVGFAVTADARGYWLATQSGQVLRFGDAVAIPAPPIPTPAGSSSTPGPTLNPVVGIAASPDGQGYWLATSTGTVIPAGDAKSYGAPRPGALPAPVTTIVATSDGGGYWLAGDDGSVYSFGVAGWFGSTASRRLNGPVNGLVPRPNGDGYWLTARDGGVFTFGKGTFYGSLGDVSLSSPIA